MNFKVNVEDIAVAAELLAVEAVRKHGTAGASLVLAYLAKLHPRELEELVDEIAVEPEVRT